jgi:hypothetical protein
MGALEPLVVSPQGDTDTLTRERTETVEEGDHERCAHIVVPAEAVTEAYITGKACEALCGKMWVPNRDPEQFPVCQGCIDTFERLTGERWNGRR